MWLKNVEDDRPIPTHIDSEIAQNQHTSTQVGCLLNATTMSLYDILCVESVPMTTSPQPGLMILTQAHLAKKTSWKLLGHLSLLGCHNFYPNHRPAKQPQPIRPPGNFPGRMLAMNITGSKSPWNGHFWSVAVACLNWGNNWRVVQRAGDIHWSFVPGIP